MEEKIHEILNTIPFCYVDIPVYEGDLLMGKILYVGKYGDCVLIKDDYGELFTMRAFPEDVLVSLYQQIYTYLN
jgi:hypothetical protein